MQFPSPEHFQELLDQCRPITVLRELEGEIPVELVLYQVQALLYLDRVDEASQLLEPLLGQLQGDPLARAKRYWSQILLRSNKVDEAIFAAQSAMEVAISSRVRAYAMLELASGYSQKTCMQLADKTLRDAKALVGAEDAMILLFEAHLLVDMDERLAARAKYEELAKKNDVWTQFYATWGRCTLSLLLGDFHEACLLANACLKISDEMIWPYFILAQLATIEEDAWQLEQAINQVVQRSPNAAALSPMQAMLARLKKRAEMPEVRRHRLKAFPTTMQKRDYCGPSTIDLVLRFWKSSEEFTEDQIAEYVKLPRGGTPIHRMQEFFHLVGFDTIRCIAPIEKLKQLLDAGYPVILTEEFPDNAHVTVAIGYDESEHVIEFQDPMTHQVIAVPEELVNHLRRTYLDSALIAFPQGRDHEKELARLGFFDEPALLWTDQASENIERGQDPARTMTLERATQRLPMHLLSWTSWMNTELLNWQNSLRSTPATRFQRSKRGQVDPAECRRKFYRVLERSQELHPETKPVHIFSGYGALLDGDCRSALDAFKHASEIDPNDSRVLAAMAECNYVLRNTEQALEMAREAIKRNPVLPVNNLWMARSLTARNDAKAEHYVRCTLELAPDWWLAHLAMAEVHLMKNDHPSARRELDVAIAMDPHRVEPRIQRALVALMDGFIEYALRELEETLKSPNAIPLYAEYNARQALGRIYFGRRQFAPARKHVEVLLKQVPADPWAVQFLAAVTCEGLVTRKTRKEKAARLVTQAYADAIDANKGHMRVITDYLNYLARFVNFEQLLKEVLDLRTRYPENKTLLPLHARWQNRAKQSPAAANLMLEAICTPGAIQNPDDLLGSVQIILAAKGVEAGEKELLSTSLVEGATTLIEIQRALGLALASQPPECHARARELLEEAVTANPKDAYVILRLGDLTEDITERERLYRKALQQAHNWPYVRAYLANFLINTGRAREALSFTEGYKNGSLDVMAASGRALYTLGRYDEAVLSYRAAITMIDQPASWMYENLWRAESQCGDHQAALITARKALKLYPKELQWYVLAANSLRNLGRFFQAYRMIQLGTTVGLRLVPVLEADYETALARGHYRAALRADKELAKWEKRGERKYLTRSEERRFRIHLELKQKKQAYKILEGGVGFNSVEAWHTPLWICLETSTWDLAEELAKSALALDSQDFTARFAQAEVLSETGRLEEAIRAFNDLRISHPYEHKPYEKLAVQHAVAGQMEEAMEMAERAVLLGPSCPFAWATRGYIYFLNKQWDAARADLEVAWKRANFSQKRERFVFWWILASLQYNLVLAGYRQFRAGREAHTNWHRMQNLHIRQHLNQTAKERFHRNRPGLWWQTMMNKVKTSFKHFRSNSSLHFPMA